MHDEGGPCRERDLILREQLMVGGAAHPHQELHRAIAGEHGHRPATNPAAERSHGGNQGEDSSIAIQGDFRIDGDTTH